MVLSDGGDASTGKTSSAKRKDPQWDELVQALDGINSALLDVIATLERTNRRRELNLIELRTAREILEASNDTASLYGGKYPLL